MNSETATTLTPPAPCSLDSIIATPDLNRRSNRPSDQRAESQAEIELTRELAKSPHDFFQKLVQMVLKLSPAESAGISLLDAKNQRFVWPAIAGNLSPHVGGGTPSNFGPCGTVLDRNESVLFFRPQRHFTYLEPLDPPLEEVLLTPFHVEGKAVGTIWAVIHQKGRKFQAEDRRLLTNLSNFASTAFQVLTAAGAIEPLLAKSA